MESLPFSSPDEFPVLRILGDWFSGLSDLRERGDVEEGLPDHRDNRRVNEL